MTNAEKCRLIDDALLECYRCGWMEGFRRSHPDSKSSTKSIGDQLKKALEIDEGKVE